MRVFVKTYGVTDEKGLRGVSMIAVFVDSHVDVDEVSIFEWVTGAGINIASYHG